MPGRLLAESTSHTELRPAFLCLARCSSEQLIAQAICPQGSAQAPPGLWRGHTARLNLTLVLTWITAHHACAAAAGAHLAN